MIRNGIGTARKPSIAYFSMEIGLVNDIPTYSGGLGVLAGDTVKSAADMRMPLIAVSLLYRKGYFRQEVSVEGKQVEFPVEWRPEDFMQRLPNTVKIQIEKQRVVVGAWQYEVKSIT